jgi:hypothetical protein
MAVNEINCYLGGAYSQVEKANKYISSNDKSAWGKLKWWEGDKRVGYYFIWVSSKILN